MTPTTCCEIGSEYSETGTRRADLLKAAARAHAKEPFCHDELVEVLRTRPEIIDGWLLWSSDKRWTPAWYLIVERQDTFRIGYCVSKSGRQLETIHQDRYKACAAYIIHELDDCKQLLVEKGKW